MLFVGNSYYGLSTMFPSLGIIVTVFLTIVIGFERTVGFPRRFSASSRRIQTEPPKLEKSELELKYPLAYAAMGGRAAEARRALDRGVDLFNQGQNKAAIDSFVEAKKRTPSDETVWAAMVPLLLLKSDCQKSLESTNRANRIDQNSLSSRLASALHNYHCATGGSGSIPSELISKKREIPVPPVLEVPVNGELIRVEFGMVPKSARQWWGEGIR
ncbi:MAG: hypothetical protein ACFFE1_10615, partial [Candidatus Thorarchaeota archaeon]